MAVFLLSAWAGTARAEDKLLHRWEEVRIVNNRTMRLTGEQFVAAGTGEQYTIYLDENGNLVSDSFIMNNQKLWSDQVVDNDGSKKPVTHTAQAATLKPITTTTNMDLKIPVMDLGPVDAKTLEAVKNAEPFNTRYKTGIHRAVTKKVQVAKEIATVSQWNMVEDNESVWAMTIRSPEALSMRVHLQNVALPAKACFMVYNTDKPGESYGPFDTRYLHGRTDFWTDSVMGSSVTIEAYAPKGVDPADIAFDITEVAHQIVSPRQIMADSSCMKDIACFSDWVETGMGVSLMVFEEPDGQYICTGCLVNTVDGLNPYDYFLTANHCISEQSVADTLEFYWFYQATDCGGDLGPMVQTGGGAQLLVSQPADPNDGNDFSFLRIWKAPPEGVTYAGWTTDAPGADEELTAIHHPDGQSKRGSKAKVFDWTSTETLPIYAPRFWPVHFTDGVVIGGSSGSPLFNAAHQIIGQLWGGNTSCAYMEGDAFYGRFDITYPIIENFLTNNASLDDPYEENDTVDEAWYPNPAYNWERMWLSEIISKGIQFDKDWYKIRVDSGFENLRVRCEYDRSMGDLEVCVIDTDGTTPLVCMRSEDGHIDFTHLLPRGGDYYILVHAANTGVEYDLWWDDLSTSLDVEDDHYEENDTLATAWTFDFDWEQTWLSSIDGLGSQYDDDWYAINVTPDYLRVLVDCRFIHKNGDIDIALYDAEGNRLARSQSIDDNEFINTVVPSGGTYYIRVYFQDAGNVYDLWWDDIDVDRQPGYNEDPYEENDTLATAWSPGYNWELMPLSSLEGRGVQNDADWYKIDVSEGYERVKATLTFGTAEGDLNLYLYDAQGNLLSASESDTDNESIDYVVASAGTYYLLVNGDNKGNIYDLVWDDYERPFDVKIVTPNGGELWTGGTTESVHWRTDINTAGTTVSLELWQGDTKVADMGESSAEFGELAQPVTVPDVPAGFDYKVRAVSVAHPEMYDESDGVITVLPMNYVGIFQPASGSVYSVGDTLKVEWMTNLAYTGSAVQVELHRNGALQATLGNFNDESGHAVSEMKIPDVVSGNNYSIVVRSTWNPDAFSDVGPVTILNPKTLKVIEPENGAVWYSGSYNKLRWSVDQAWGGSAIQMQLWRADAMVADLGIVWSPDQESEVNIQLPVVEPGDDYWVRIISVWDSTIYDDSDAYFTILPVKDVKVLSPNGGEKWTIGQKVKVRWSKVDQTAGTAVMINLIKDGADVGLLGIAWSLSDTPTMEIVVPVVPEGSDYKIRVTSLWNTDLFDESDQPITIKAVR